MSRRRRRRHPTAGAGADDEANLTDPKFVGGSDEARALIRAMSMGDVNGPDLDATEPASDDGEEVLGVATGELYDPDWEPPPEGVEEELGGEG